MKIKELKSGVVITDPVEITRVLKEAVAKRTESMPAIRARETQTYETKDGKTAIMKMTAKAEGSIGVPDLSELKALCEKRGIPWLDSYALRAIPYWGSDERTDGHGDIVEQVWNFNTFQDNPVLCDSHRWENPPVGNVLDWKVVQRVDKNYNGPALWLLALFTPAEIYAWGDQIYRLVASRFLRGGSVGFVSHKVIDVKDEQERAELGLGRWGYILSDNELLEYSPTTIGANPGALSILASAKSRGQLEAKDITVVRELLRREAATEENWEETDDSILAFARVLFPESEFEEHKGLAEPVKAEPVTKTTAVPVETRLAELEENVRTLMTGFDQFAQSTSSMLSDIRDQLEGKAFGGGTISDSEITDGLLEGATFLSDDGSGKEN